MDQRPHRASIDGASDVAVLEVAVFQVPGVWQLEGHSPICEQLPDDVGVLLRSLLLESRRQVLESEASDGEGPREELRRQHRLRVPLHAVARAQQAQVADKAVEPTLPRYPCGDARLAGHVVPQPPRAAGCGARVQRFCPHEVRPIMELLRPCGMQARGEGHPMGERRRGEERVLLPLRDRRLNPTRVATEDGHERLQLRWLQLAEQRPRPLGQGVDHLPLLALAARAADHECRKVHGAGDQLQEEAHLHVLPHVAVQGRDAQQRLPLERAGHVRDNGHGVPAVGAHVVIQLDDVPLVLLHSQAGGEDVPGHDLDRGVRRIQRYGRPRRRVWHLDGILPRPGLPRRGWQLLPRLVKVIDARRGRRGYRRPQRRDDDGPRGEQGSPPSLRQFANQHVHG
mmetsp:Transcript_29407/g.83732  ORF Transcript_29407/g.83732 Transcript_29407/m.83732 type:complete len:398 (-) Transcript_29407:73-1266(-)